MVGYINQNSSKDVNPVLHNKNKDPDIVRPEAERGAQADAGGWYSPLPRFNSARSLQTYGGASIMSSSNCSVTSRLHIKREGSLQPEEVEDDGVSLSFLDMDGPYPRMTPRSSQTDLSLAFGGPSPTPLQVPHPASFISTLSAYSTGPGGAGSIGSPHNRNGGSVRAFTPSEHVGEQETLAPLNNQHSGASPNPSLHGYLSSGYAPSGSFVQPTTDVEATRSGGSRNATFTKLKGMLTSRRNKRRDVGPKAVAVQPSIESIGAHHSTYSLEPSVVPIQSTPSITSPPAPADGKKHRKDRHNGWRRFVPSFGGRRRRGDTAHAPVEAPLAAGSVENRGSSIDTGAESSKVTQNLQVENTLVGPTSPPKGDRPPLVINTQPTQAPIMRTRGLTEGYHITPTSQLAHHSPDSGASNQAIYQQSIEELMSQFPRPGSPSDRIPVSHNGSAMADTEETEADKLRDFYYAVSWGLLEGEQDVLEHDDVSPPVREESAVMFVAQELTDPPRETCDGTTTIDEMAKAAGMEVTPHPPPASLDVQNCQVCRHCRTCQPSGSTNGLLLDSNPPPTASSRAPQAFPQVVSKPSSVAVTDNGNQVPLDQFRTVHFEETSQPVPAPSPVRSVQMPAVAARKLSKSRIPILRSPFRTKSKTNAGSNGNGGSDAASQEMEDPFRKIESAAPVLQKNRSA